MKGLLHLWRVFFNETHGFLAKLYQEMYVCMIWRKICTSVLSNFHKLLSRIIQFSVCENCADSIKSPRLCDCPSSSFQGQNMTENVASFSLLPLVFKNASWIVPSNIHSIVLFVELTSINNPENIVLWSWFSMSDANIYRKHPKPDCIAQTMFHNMYNTYTLNYTVKV